MKRLMLDHAFRFVDSVVFRVSTENIRSQKAVEKLGATRVHIEPDALGRGDNVLFRLHAPTS
jgi:RimJ/RimL family protein N-acetyltransferase